MKRNQPNILLILTDQQRWDSCGPAAPAFMRTPHYNHLCREGIEFSSAYADCPICVPARVSVMTGKFSYTHGMIHNGRTSAVMGRDGTLPALLHDLGYHTCAIGKMHFHPQRTRHGFDEMILPDDYYRQMRRSGNPLQPMRHGLGQNELYPSLSTVPEPLTLTSWITEQCVDYILERRDESVPFFLMCSYSKPHPPLDPPEPYYSMYRDCDIPEPVHGDWSEDDACPEVFKRIRQQLSTDLLPPEVLREARAAYYGLITHIDYNLGRIFSALKDKGLFRDTLIIYTSDHGEFLGDHYTGGKFFSHEPSSHVPFVLRLPHSWDNRMHGTRIPVPVTHADILPTLVHAAGGKVPADCDGIDLISLARGDFENPRQYLEGIFAVNTNVDWLSLTDGRWKYIWYPEGPSEQFFDLESDPQELHNLADADKYKEKCREMHAILLERHSARHSACVENGELIRRELRGDTEQDRRNCSWPGYHTDRFPADIRH